METSGKAEDLNTNELINHLLKQLESKDRQMEQLNQTIANLTETIHELKRKIFGISSEKSANVPGIDGQLSLFDPLGIDEPVQVPETIRVTSHKKKSRATHEELARYVPITTIDLELEGDALNYPYCNTKMEDIGSKVVREEIRITPAKVERVQYVQHSYACPVCRDDGEATIEKAPVPASLISHSRASASAVAFIMYQKCINCQPFYRQEKDWEQLGVKLNRGTMASWFNTCAAEYLEPVYNKLHEYLLKQSVIHADETTCQVLHEGDKTPESKSYIWLYTSGAFEEHRIVIYEYQPSRGGYHAAKFLADFHGFVHTDGFSGYNRLTDIIRCGCWAHLRRYMFEAIPKTKGASAKASPAYIGYTYCEQLFQIEKTLKELQPEERQKQRLERERPVLDAFWKWINGMNALGGSKLAKAITYAKNQSPYMENYLQDGRCSISNNAAERAVKSYVMGRKNFLFHDTVKGARASAVVYTLTETAKIRLYLETVMAKMLDYKNEPDSILEKLMPWSEAMKGSCSLENGNV
ncbi:IS66 family transposase [Lacrimispora sp. JR3]|uniref:IS66 family transposase n=1 Tax=Lacrimispora sinapis TaxID=3111456 RepID=UPI003747DAF9